MAFLKYSLERRLVDNYEKNRDPSLVGEISRVLIGNPEPPASATVRDFDLLTQNIVNSIFLEGYIAGALETAYDFCIEALKKMESSSEFYGVFHSRARVFSRRLADFSVRQDEKMRYLETALSHSDAACEFYKTRDKSLYGRSLSSRGEVKKILALIAQNEERIENAIDWFIQSARDKSEGAAVVEEFENTHACHRYAFAAYQEFEAALLSANLKTDLLMNAVEHAGKSEKFCDFDDAFLANVRLNLGKYNKMLYDLTHNPDFLDEAHHYYRLASSYYVIFDDDKHNKMRYAADNCLRRIEIMKLSHKKEIDIPRKMKKKKARRQSERRIIEEEWEDLG